MEVEFCGFAFFWRPGHISVPAIGTALKRSGLPRRLFADPMQIVAEEWRLNIFAEFARGFMPAEGNDADGIAFGCLPFAVKPWACHDEIRVIGVVLPGAKIGRASCRERV